MKNEISVINLKDLNDTAKLLIDKISKGVGCIFEPWQIKRVAKAEADAKLTHALINNQISLLEQRSLNRFLFEQSRMQENMENIIRKSLLFLNNGSKPSEMSEDWIINFFDKCRLISDEEMQTYWGKILAGEANAPGKFSKRTINFMTSIEKSDALEFTRLCSFNWKVGAINPLIYNHNSEIYTNNGINFEVLKHLEDIGLITFNHIKGFEIKGAKKTMLVKYNQTGYKLIFQNESENIIKLGTVLLTNVGRELSIICKPEKVNEFENNIIQKWRKSGISVIRCDDFTELQ